MVAENFVSLIVSCSTVLFEEKKIELWCTSLQACVLPAPRRSFCGNYARVVNQILQGLTNMHVCPPSPTPHSVCFIYVLDMLISE